MWELVSKNSLDKEIESDYPSTFYVIDVECSNLASLAIFLSSITCINDSNTYFTHPNMGFSWEGLYKKGNILRFYSAYPSHVLIPTVDLLDFMETIMGAINIRFMACSKPSEVYKLWDFIKEADKRSNLCKLPIEWSYMKYKQFADRVNLEYP